MNKSIKNKRIIALIPTMGHPRINKRLQKMRDQNCRIFGVYFERNYNKQNALFNFDKSYSLGHIKDKNYFSRTFKIIKAYFLLKKESKSADILYSFSSDLLYISVISRQRKNLIFHEIGDIRIPKGYLLKKIVTILNSIIYKKHVNKFIVTSPNFSKYLQNNYGIHKSKILIIENKLPRKYFNKKIRPCLPKTPITLGVIGQLRYQTFVDLIKAAHNHQPKNFQIYIYGEGPKVKEVKHLFDGNFIRYFGSFSYPQDLNKIYSAVDYSYVVYPNTEINVRLALPNKLYESIYFRKPIIVSDLTALSKTVIKYNLGKSFCSSNSHKLITFLSSKEAVDLHSEFVRSIEKVPKEFYIE